MAVREVNENYRCNVCGNEVVVTAVGGGVLVCCGAEMARLETTIPPVNVTDID